MNIIEEIDTGRYYGFIYETTNLINGKKYIGQCAFNRINGWKSYLGSGLHFKRAVKKYGKQNFQREILALAETIYDLDRLEIEYIDKLNAVDSDEYYNLKRCARGGDTFTDNPNKEETRKLLKKIRAGKGNSQYGKPKSDKMIESVKKANSKKIMVNDIIYNSVKECSIALEIGVTTLCFRLGSDYQPDYLYLDNNGFPIQKDIKKWKHAPKKIVVEGVEYRSIAECSDMTGVSKSCVNYRLKSKNFQEYQYKNIDG